MIKELEKQGLKLHQEKQVFVGEWATTNSKENSDLLLS